jgi:hypothetical protein
MDDYDLVPFPNEVVSMLVEVVSFLIKLVVLLIAQQTTEPMTVASVVVEHGKSPLSIHSATNSTRLHEYSLLINSKLSRYSFTTSHHMFS